MDFDILHPALAGDHYLRTGDQRQLLSDAAESAAMEARLEERRRKKAEDDAFAARVYGKRLAEGKKSARWE